MLIDYGKGEKEAILSVETMTVYEQEFGRDIIQDLFGRVVVRKEQHEEDVEFAVDYRDTNWTAIVRVLWAALKTADGSTPSYKEWSKSVGNIDLNAIGRPILDEAWKMFFRAGASDSE